MKGKLPTPRYAVRLVLVVVVAATLFFVGLQLFVPPGSRLTGSYDAQSLLYIASAPVAYTTSQTCGNTGCHTDLVKQWETGAHGARQEQSKCEVCHGPQGDHPDKTKKLPKVRGDGNLVELCLVCHRKMKARKTTGQPQIVPQEHPVPHEGVLKCTNCHNPHSPGLGAPKIPAASQKPADKVSGATTTMPVAGAAADGATLAAGCFACHGPNGRGGFAPALAAQAVAALKDKLTKFRSGELKGTMMNPVAAKLTDDEINTLAEYLASLP